MTNETVSLVIDYENYIDIRFLSSFFFHLKALNTFVFREFENQNQEIRDVVYFVKEFISKKREREEESLIIDVDELLGELFKNKKFKKLYEDYYVRRMASNRYQFFISDEANIKILSVEKKCVKFMLGLAVAYAIFVLSSAIALDILRAQSVRGYSKIEFPKKVEIYIETSRNKQNEISKN